MTTSSFGVKRAEEKPRFTGEDCPNGESMRTDRPVNLCCLTLEQSFNRL
jgi:hypothetical protein